MLIGWPSILLNLIHFYMKFLLLLLIAIIGPNCSFADDKLPPCQNLFSECFFTTGTERENCVFTASKHPFCRGTELGDLIVKREINKKCQKNFDLKISKIINDQVLSIDDINELSQILIKCN